MISSYCKLLFNVLESKWRMLHLGCLTGSVLHLVVPLTHYYLHISSSGFSKLLFNVLGSKLRILNLGCLTGSVHHLVVPLIYDLYKLSTIIIYGIVVSYGHYWYWCSQRQPWSTAIDTLCQACWSWHWLVTALWYKRSSHTSEIHWLILWQFTQQWWDMVLLDTGWVHCLVMDYRLLDAEQGALVIWYNCCIVPEKANPRSDFWSSLYVS